MRQQELNIGLRRAWFQLALVGFALAFLLWLKYQGPQSIPDVTGYLLLVCALSVAGNMQVPSGLLFREIGKRINRQSTLPIGIA